MDAIAKSIQYSCCPVDSEGGKQKKIIKLLIRVHWWNFSGCTEATVAVGLSRKTNTIS